MTSLPSALVEEWRCREATLHRAGLLVGQAFGQQSRTPSVSLSVVLGVWICIVDRPLVNGLQRAGRMLELDVSSCDKECDWACQRCKPSGEGAKWQDQQVLAANTRRLLDLLRLLNLSSKRARAIVRHAKLYTQIDGGWICLDDCVSEVCP